MATHESKPFLLFAAGEPDRGNDGRALVSTFHRTAAIVQLPPKDPEVLPQRGEVRWHYPVEQRMCVQLVLSLAEPMGKAVKVVDVHRPAGDHDLVERWVTRETLLPLLVSPNGGRLQGIESFVPSRLKHFLSEA